MIDDELSEAVVAYIGWKNGASFPLADYGALTGRFGEKRGRELILVCHALKRVPHQPRVDWAVDSWEVARSRAKSHVETSHPQLSSDAVDALMWCFDYDWK